MSQYPPPRTDNKSCSTCRHAAYYNPSLNSQQITRQAGRATGLAVCRNPKCATWDPVYGSGSPSVKFASSHKGNCGPNLTHWEGR